MQRADGSLTCAEAEIHDLFTEAWHPVFCKHAESEPSCTEWLQHYGPHLRQHDLHLEAITADDICRELSSMQTSAPGLDAITLEHLLLAKRVCPQLISELARMYNLIEEC
eukprot:4463824-Amphidinium_carterae.1